MVGRLKKKKTNKMTAHRANIIFSQIRDFVGLIEIFEGEISSGDLPMAEAIIV